MHRLVWQWFELAESIDGRRVGGIVHLFGQEMWCVWKPDELFTEYRLEGLRALDHARVIVAIAVMFPTLRRTHPQVASIVGAKEGIARA